MNNIKNYDSGFCGSLPLNFINLIQPHGILMILGLNELKIIQLSENVKDILGIDPYEILNLPIQDLIDLHDFENLKNKIEKWSVKDKIPLSLRFNTKEGPRKFSASITPGESFVMIELEHIQEEEEKIFLEIYQEIRFIIASLKDAVDVSEVADIAAIEIKKLSGFDRVMIYKFDDDWNGSVIAEAKSEDMESYMHLRFPASDIPKQARDLYHKNPYRLIPDVDFSPVKILPVLNPVTRSFTDLSECTLRSVPPVHIEYLKNMGVKASMSTALIIDNKLWGLISCHHRTPKFLSYPYRTAFELLSTMISLQLSAKENERTLSLRTILNDIYFQLLERILSEKPIYESLFMGSPSVMDLLSISGAAIKSNGKYKLIGETPNEEQIVDLISWAGLFDMRQIYSTHVLPQVYPEGDAVKEKASGIIIIPISPKDKDYILGFRKEVVQTVNWGGNPNQAINFEADGKTYHPRNSFAKWKEEVEGVSSPWMPQEIEVAEKLRTSILERLLNDKF